MKKKIRFCFWLAVNIVILFSMAMAWSFLSQWLASTSFFGDTPCTNEYGCGNLWFDDKSWGLRHYLYFWMCLCLFMSACTRVIMWIDWFWSDKNIKNTIKTYFMATSTFTPTTRHMGVLTFLDSDDKRALRKIFLTSPNKAVAVNTIMHEASVDQYHAVIAYEIAEHMLNPWNLDENHLN